MNRYFYFIALGFVTLMGVQAHGQALSDNRAKTANGTLEGITEPSGIRSFKGIPFAAPPIGELRWKPPQPAANWQGVRKADKFGPRAMQNPIFGDMAFRSEGMSEDCLYLNVWTPAKSSRESLPVLVYFFGGGFQAGDGSEGRYDGESMARKGIVAITVNYRLNVFGFMAHPELTKESPNHASGNYGLLDQYAALLWVRENIATFGGDPKKVTIAGESAGSIAVSAQMASPLSKKLFAGAIGESGSLMGALTPVPLADAEAAGTKFAATNGVNSLAELRGLPATKLLEFIGKRGAPWFSLTIDGYFLQKDPFALFAAGEQAKVPILVGWNSEESNARGVLGQDKPTVANFEKAVKRLYPKNGDQAFKVYHPVTDDEVMAVATDLASDRFIAFSTWRWADAHSQTGGKPVYRYYFSHARPAMKSPTGNNSGLPKGAPHASEIEYALGNLDKNNVYAWTPDDFKVSDIMQTYFANFIKKANPNGKNLPKWNPVKANKPAGFMHIDTETKLETEQHRDRYLFLIEESVKH